MTVRINGLDGNLCPRVWAEGKDFMEAQKNLAEAIHDYVRRRPETGPVSTWRAEYSFQFPDENLPRHAFVRTTLESR